ncbi:MAG: hypothetical protein J7L45_01690 [Candidatus Aenigmarchaeota archaeon]|nr:hypothetical protein [Candidatus Aenigmarchaeota archaeon]
MKKKLLSTERKRLNGLIIEDYNPEISEIRVYTIDIDLNPFLEDLEKRNAKPKEVIWQFGKIRHSLEPSYLLADGSLEDQIKRTLISRVDENMKSYIEFSYFRELEDEELKKILDHLDKNIEMTLVAAVIVSEKQNQYKFRPGYRWEDGIKIYEDLDEIGKVMKKVNEIKTHKETS